MGNMSFFKPAARYPADPRAVFILALSVFSGLTALALEAAPESLQAVLPRWGVILWGVLLCVGSAVTLAGMARQTVNGIISEQVGSVAVGVTTVYYSSLAFYQIGWDALQNIGIILAWGLACFWRWGQLQALINASAEKGKAEHEARGPAVHRAEERIQRQVDFDQAASDDQRAVDARDDLNGPR